MRRLTQQTLINLITTAEAVVAHHLEVCRIVTGLAEQLPPDDPIAGAIIQNTAAADYDIREHIKLIYEERANTNATKTRNNYMRRRREEITPIYTDDDLDIALGERGLPTPDLVEDEE